ncbi:MAG: hypothetical protein IJW25_00230 [Clostridia bacterium]|nr:hypothetical protein [Clostridia bacterium]
MEQNKRNLVESLWENGQSKDVLGFFAKHCKNKKTILDINSTHPYLLNTLSQQGFEVFSMPSKDVKGKLNENIKTVSGNLLKIKGKNTYEVISVLDFSLEKLKNYLEVDTCFGNLKKHLDKDGIIIIDYLKPKNIAKTGQPETNREITLLKYRGKKRIARIKNVYKADDKEICLKQKIKVYSLKKLRQIANKNELDIVGAFENFTDNVSNENSSRIQLILKHSTVLPDKVKKQHKKQVVTKKGKIKEMSRKTFAVTMLMVIVGAALCGSSVGNMYLANTITPAYDSYSEDALRDNVNFIAWKGKTPDQLSPTKAFIVAEQQMIAETNRWTMTKDGVIKNSFANQTVGGAGSFDGSKITSISTSSGFIDVASKTEYVIGSNEVVETDGTLGNDKTVESITWKEPKPTVTVEKYRDEWGVSPQGIVAYIVSSKTVISETEWEQVGENYKATVGLHKESSVILYVKQMKKTSGLSSSPVFKEINLTFTLDKNFNIIEISIAESYSMSIGITVGCEGELVLKFNYN